MLPAVALLTRKIADLAEHLRLHKKDHSSRRWVLGAVRWVSVCCLSPVSLLEVVCWCIMGMLHASEGTHGLAAGRSPRQGPWAAQAAAVALPIVGCCGFFLAHSRLLTPWGARPPACRGLDAMLNQRRTLLQYLRRSKFDMYAVLISRLGLKDSYGPQDRLSSRYKAAAAAGGGGSVR